MIASEGPAVLLRDTKSHPFDDHPLLAIWDRGINDGAGFLFVSHRGDIYPSGFLPLRTGNVREDSLAEVYRRSPLFREVRDGSLTGKCGVCPYRRVCGGSRARAYALTGDVLASDPLCAYVPKAWSGDS